MFGARTQLDRRSPVCHRGQTLPNGKDRARLNDKIPSLSDLQAQIDSVPLWYHTMELSPGVVTRGWFDLRPIVNHLPWPDVKGKRCLDIGTYDGFLAFEMERRGASEVVATDIASHNDWDWPVVLRDRGGAELAKMAGPEKGVGFQIAASAFKSTVQKKEISIYDLSPASIGVFDVVVCGSLLLHLRDPIRALEAVRSVCRGKFMSCEQVDMGLSLLAPHRPAARLNHDLPLCQWWIPNVVGHRQMLVSGGFEVIEAGKPYVLPHGLSHPRPDGSLRTRVTMALRRAWAGQRWGVPHAAVVARPTTAD
jgi:tRNA (mo5U34)-methyltransferase